MKILPVRNTLQVVIIGILCQATVQECPCHVIDSILFVLNCLCDNFCVKVVMHAMIKMALYGQRLVQELFEEIFLSILTHEDALGVVIVHRSVCSSNHLNDIGCGLKGDGKLIKISQLKIKLIQLT
jgi:hypothetical protein